MTPNAAQVYEAIMNCPRLGYGHYRRHGALKNVTILSNLVRWNTLRYIRRNTLR